MRYLQITNPWASEGCNRGDREETLELPCEVIRSGRRTVSLQIKEDGSLQLRIPYMTSIDAAMDFAARHEVWIADRYKKVIEDQENKPHYSESEKNEYKKKLRPVLEHRAAFYAELMGVDYGRISVRDQKTRWGSCSARGNLSFNWKLALVPPDILDYVVVHELAHRLEMNHSARFWAQVERVLPDYRARRAWLKEYGGRQ